MTSLNKSRGYMKIFYFKSIQSVRNIFYNFLIDITMRLWNSMKNKYIYYIVLEVD